MLKINIFSNKVLYYINSWAILATLCSTSYLSPSIYLVYFPITGVMRLKMEEHYFHTNFSFFLSLRKFLAENNLVHTCTRICKGTVTNILQHTLLLRAFIQNIVSCHMPLWLYHQLLLLVNIKCRAVITLSPRISRVGRSLLRSFSKETHNILLLLHLTSGQLLNYYDSYFPCGDTEGVLRVGISYE